MTRSLGVACLLLAALATTGCALIGPASIRAGRPAYNETIVATNNQQLLAMIVRMRYGEPSGLLAVSGITANMKLQSNAGAEFGFGSNTNYQGNLVPLSIGFAYEENPTISYTPIQGEKYLRALLSPIPMDLTVLVLRAMRDSPLALNLLVRSINGTRNPDFMAHPSVAEDPHFTRLVELFRELSLQGLLTWVEEEGEPRSFGLAIASDETESAGQIAELYRLLGLAAPQASTRIHLVPVRLGIGSSDGSVIWLETRSLFEMFNIVAASVEVPEDHVASELATPLPPLGPAGRGIHIRRSKRSPDDAIASVKHHGWWYSIEGTDTRSKLAFRILEALASVRIADSVDHERAKPVLTIPVAQ